MWCPPPKPTKQQGSNSGGHHIRAVVVSAPDYQSPSTLPHEKEQTAGL